MAVEGFTAPDSPVRAVAFDMDGTILDAFGPDGVVFDAGPVILPEVVEALQELHRRGTVCLTATGRWLDFQVELLDRYEIGARTGVVSGLMANERTIYFASHGEYEPLSTWNDEVLARWNEVYPQAMELLDEAIAEGKRRGYDVGRLFSEEISFARGLPTIGCQNATEAHELEQWVEQQLEDRPDLPLQTNRNVRIVQVFDKQVGKGNVLAQIAASLGLRNDEVLALGDSSNDYSMLNGTKGFRAATFANAEDRLKEMVRGTGGFVASAPAGRGVVESFRAYRLL